MADKKNEPLTTETTEKKASITDQIPGAGNAMAFIKKNQNILLAAGAAVVLLVIFLLMRGGGNDAAKEGRAENELRNIRQYMQMDSFNVVLNGNDTLGIKPIKKFISTYKGTEAADEGRLYGAVCYMNAGNPAEAIKILKDAGSMGKQLEARKLSLLGDAYSEKGTAVSPISQADCKEAVDYYRKAADKFPEDDANAAAYLYKAAQLYSQMGNSPKAIELYKEIKNKYPNARQIIYIEKYLGKEGVEN